MPNATGVDEPKHHALFTVWHRARMRAVAHHSASVRLQREGRDVFQHEIKINILSVLLLVLGLSISDGGLARLVTHLFDFSPGAEILEIIGRALITISALTSIYGLYLNIISDRYEKTVLHARHKLISRQFMSISQKARRPDSGLFDDHYCNNLVFQLNDQLETILTSAENPEDEDYQLAGNLMQKIFSSTVIGVSESFVPESAEIDIDSLKMMDVNELDKHNLDKIDDNKPRNFFTKIIDRIKMMQKYVSGRDDGS